MDHNQINYLSFKGNNATYFNTPGNLREAFERFKNLNNASIETWSDFACMKPACTAVEFTKGDIVTVGIPDYSKPNSGLQYLVVTEIKSCGGLDPENVIYGKDVNGRIYRYDCSRYHIRIAGFPKELLGFANMEEVL